MGNEKQKMRVLEILKKTNLFVYKILRKETVHLARHVQNEADTELVFVRIEHTNCN